MDITKELSGKSILIWGYGREGHSTEAFLQRFCNAKNVEVYEGSKEELDDRKYDYVIKSPGIIMEEDNPKYISQTELFLMQFRKQTIGVTGTKGKSTTASLIYTVLKAATDKNVILLGNIGLPCLDYYDQIDENTIVVFEMSCHQLAHAKYSPHVAVFLNLYEEHLDYYKTVDKYFEAKSHIAVFQEADDYFYVGDNVPDIPTKAHKAVISSSIEYDYPIALKGTHNQYNAEFVFQIASKVYGCKKEAILEAMKSFVGLPHRLEHIGKLNEIDYYDDSISTIPKATIQAALSVDNAATILVGGMDRNIDYSMLVEFIQNNKKFCFICMYESGKRIFDEVKACVNVYFEEDLKAAVARAKLITKKGTACILSPAAASYGYFKNFEERGNTFKSYVFDENI